MLFKVQRSIQASTNLAALAAAQDINCCSSAPGKAKTSAVIAAASITATAPRSSRRILRAKDLNLFINAPTVFRHWTRPVECDVRGQPGIIHLEIAYLQIRETAADCPDALVSAVLHALSLAHAVPLTFRVIVSWLGVMLGAALLTALTVLE